MIQTHGSSMTSAHYSRLGPQECEKIHLASLEILERIGVDVHDEKAREILVKGGAWSDGLRVRIPAYMVARALETAPSTLTLYDRKGKVAMRAGKYNSYYGGGSDCLGPACGGAVSCIAGASLGHAEQQRRERMTWRDLQDFRCLFGRELRLRGHQALRVIQRGFERSDGF